MIKVLVTTLACVVAISLTSTVITLSAQKEQLITGTLKSVDSESNVITLETANGEHFTYSVDNTTRITIEGRPVRLADLNRGLTVNVEAEGGKAIAIES